MLMNLIHTQGITIMILILYFLQKNARLEKEEGRSVFGWFSHLVFVNWLLMCLFSFQGTAFNLLMLASVNGLATISFLFLQKLNFQKVCPK